MIHLSEHDDLKSARKTTIIASATAILFCNLDVVGKEMIIFGLAVIVDPSFITVSATVIVTFLILNYVVKEFSRENSDEYSSRIVEVNEQFKNQTTKSSKIARKVILISVYIDRIILQVTVPVILFFIALHYLLKQ